MHCVVAILLLCALPSLIDSSVSMIMEMSSLSERICIYDTLDLRWTVRTKDEILDFNNLYLVIEDTENSEELKRVFSTLLTVSAKFSVNNETISIDALKPSNNGLIRCVVDEDYCIPKIDAVISYAERMRISISFDQPTNTPILESSLMINSALDVTPKLFGGAIGEWIDARTLEIALERPYLDALVAAYKAGETIRFDIRHNYIYCYRLIL